MGHGSGVVLEDEAISFRAGTMVLWPTMNQETLSKEAIMIPRRLITTCLIGSCLHLCTATHFATAQSMEFAEGVFAAFINCEGNPNLCRVHFSPDGKNL